MTHDHRTAPAGHARRRLALAALVLLLLLAGCAGTGTGTGGDGTGGPGGTRPPAPGATWRSTLPPRPSVPPTKPPPENPPPTTGPSLNTGRKPEITEPGIPNRELMKLRGRLVDAVEPGCVPFRADDGSTWLLIGVQDRSLPSGVFQVTGYEIPGMASTCQQGRPFRVVSILVP
jgi:hypothetical protein